MRAMRLFVLLLLLALGLTCWAVAADAPAQPVHVYLPKVMRGAYWGPTPWPTATPTLTPAATPAPDLGDAPDSSNSRGAPMTAYPGVRAQFPTVFGAGSPPYGPRHVNEPLLFHLGRQVSVESEADSGWDEDGVNNIDPAADRADRDGGDDGLELPTVLPSCETLALRFRVTALPGAPSQVYVNLWFDWDRNGRWGDVPACQSASAPEWAVRNQVVALPGPGFYTFTTTNFLVFNPQPEQPMWLRITLSDVRAPDAASDGSGPSTGYAFGETEDYLLPGRGTPTATATATRTSTPTLTPTCPYAGTPTATLANKTPSATPTWAPCVTAPTLLAPANGVTLTTLLPLLRWDAGNQGNATEVWIQLSRYANFSSLRWEIQDIAETGIQEYQIRDNLEPATRFYWRVRLKCRTETAPWSAVWSFTTGSGGALLPAPTLLSPSNGAVLTTQPVTLTWAALPGAAEYYVKWHKSSEPYSNYIDWVTGTQCVPRGLAPNTLYEWSVTARNDYAWGTASAWWRFTSPSAAALPAAFPSRKVLFPSGR